jgi:hypothetical protein
MLLHHVFLATPINPDFELIPMKAIAASKAAAGLTPHNGSMQTARQLFEV